MYREGADLMKEIVAIVGPTGVGKTSLGVEIAKRFNGEVISGDSMQIYKGMDIGTAKVTRDEKQNIVHHMIDIKEPDETFSAAEFQRTVTKKIDEIQRRGKLPVLVGGTGLYIQSILYDYKFPEKERDVNLQSMLQRELEQYGAERMWNRLNEIDPKAARKIHPNNHRRLIRAMEIAKTEDRAMGEVDSQAAVLSKYNPIIIGLEMDRDILYNRINERVDVMMEKGLLEEVRKLYEQGLEKNQSLQAIGYKEFIPYFKGEQSLEESVNILKRNSRRYAKRQYTWFRNKMNVQWYRITPETAAETRIIILRDLAGMLKQK